MSSLGVTRHLSLSESNLPSVRGARLQSGKRTPGGQDRESMRMSQVGSEALARSSIEAARRPPGSPSQSGHDPKSGRGGGRTARAIAYGKTAEAFRSEARRCEGLWVHAHAPPRARATRREQLTATMRHALCCLYCIAAAGLGSGNTMQCHATVDRDLGSRSLTTDASLRTRTPSVACSCSGRRSIATIIPLPTSASADGRDSGDAYGWERGVVARPDWAPGRAAHDRSFHFRQQHWH